MVWFTKCQLGVMLAAWAAITLAVGLMAGLINKGDGTCGETPPATTTTETPVTTEEVPDGPWGDPFLREFVYPLHYDLWLYPDFYNNGSQFYGREDITIQVEDDTQFIILHTNFIDISNTELRINGSDEKEAIENTFLYQRNQYWVVETRRVLSPGVYVLHLEFTGSLVNGIVGYYKSNYTNSITGEKSWLATSKFQPSDARKAFPNWDEPKFKATFSITLRHWRNFTALSNMPLKSELIEDETWQESSFETTPLMSSYLTCFIVFDFVRINNTLANGKVNSIWAPPDRIGQGQLALEFSKDAQDFMETELDMKFQLPKLDHVAVPDYPSGATEHWGLITYRESRLLFDPTTGSESNAASVRHIVAHEVAHHFFGNAITCRSWDDIWLNEGYANFYEYKTTGTLVADYQDDKRFVTSIVQPVMQDDALSDSRPVSKPVTTPEEATAAFTGIVYSKGASIIRMMEDFLGKDTFRNATRFYLKKYEFGLATTKDLYEAYAEYTGVDIPTIMNPWTLQMGLPLVTVTEAGSNVLTLTPQRFLTDPEADPEQPPEPEYGYEWYIPLSYETQGGITGRTWINKTEVNITDPRSSNSEWIKFNREQMGFFRLNYSPAQWEKLSQQLLQNHTILESTDRASILDDAFNIARATLLEYPIALDLTKYLDQEEDYFPWSSIRSSLDYISDMMYGVGAFSMWRGYLQETVTPMMNSLGVQGGGTYLEKMNRASNIMPLACRHGQLDCLLNSTQLFEAWLQNETNAIDQDIRRVVYQFGMLELSGVEGVWDTVLERFEQTDSITEKGNLMFTLAQTDRQWLIKRYLEYAIDENNIREQDFFTIINYLAYNLDSNRYLWDWVRANYDALVARFGLANRYLGWMVPNIVSGYNTPFLLEEVEAFYDAYPDAGAGTAARAESLSSIRSNIAWMDRNLEPIIDWLKSNTF